MYLYLCIYVSAFGISSFWFLIFGLIFCWFDTSLDVESAEGNWVNELTNQSITNGLIDFSNNAHSMVDKYGNGASIFKDPCVAEWEPAKAANCEQSFFFGILGFFPVVFCLFKKIVWIEAHVHIFNHHQFILVYSRLIIQVPTQVSSRQSFMWMFFWLLVDRTVHLIVLHSCDAFHRLVSTRFQSTSYHYSAP